MGGGRDKFYSGEGTQGLAGVVAGGVGVVDGQDARVAGEGGQIKESSPVGGAAQGGDVAEIGGKLPGEHGVEFAFGNVFAIYNPCIMNL